MRRLNPLFIGILSAALAIGIGACGPDPAPPGPGTTDLGIAIDIDESDGGDASSTDAADGSYAAETAAPSKKKVGEACELQSDCLSGWCIETSLGQVCTLTCLNDCPGDWQCREVTNPSGDPAYICVDPFAWLCSPCLSDDECEGLLGLGNTCMDRGDAGSFCGVTCENSSECPAGFLCKDGVSLTGAAARQCMRPDSAECTCPDIAAAVGAATACHITNEFGVCDGARFCQPNAVDTALSSCDAAVPAAEVCNGQDDDCDNQVDEGLTGTTCEVTNTFGACPGTSKCSSGQFTCLGPAPEAEVCNGLDDDCDGETDENSADVDGDGVPDCLDDDADGDGVPNEDDCKPLDAAVFPGAIEVCNGKDDDCDGAADPEDTSDCAPYFKDFDGDGYGDETVASRCLCGADGPAKFTAIQGGDCDDLLAGASPAGTEACNAIDDDCDGDTDEDQGDADDDGIADCEDPDDDNDGVDDIADCAPLDAGVYPGATEVCDGDDEDCDGVADEPGAEGCDDWYPDADADGFAAIEAVALCLCGADSSVSYTTQKTGDCDDLRASAFPEAPELCNGLDDDCDGETDEDIGDFDEDGVADCVDLDDDGDGVPDTDDCRPLDAAIYPGALEVCDGFDNNCDGFADEAGAEGCAPWFEDKDGDGDGVIGGAPQCLCGEAGEGLFTAKTAKDCDDLYGAVNPDAAETCDGLDNDCDGETDEGSGDFDGDGLADCIDDDDDGDGVPDLIDCAPADASRHPGAAEICDGDDENCDGVVDEVGAAGCVPTYIDADGDGAGATDSPELCACGPIPGSAYTATTPGDCNDYDPNISPLVAEVCNGFDDDCDGETDEGATDSNGDGVADCADDDDDGDGTIDALDCAPLDPAIHPGATEVCGGGDEDCDGAANEIDAMGCTPFFKDADGDGFGADGVDARCLCEADPAGIFVGLKGGDCQDGLPQVFEGAPELCDGLDNDCDGETDEDLPDLDGDGIADCVDPDIDGDGAGNQVDCMPEFAPVHPGQVEACNGVDDDCDGATDEAGAFGCSLWYMDIDGDTYPAEGVDPACLCAASPATFFTAGDLPKDCDDIDPAQSPAATEVCNQSDDDCDGMTDEGVGSPCGGCATVCALGAGQGFSTALMDGATTASGTTAAAEGGITATAADAAAAPYPWVRLVFQGWPTGGTTWDMLFVAAEFPGATSIELRWRTAATEAGLTAAVWVAASEAVPPDVFPLSLGMVSPWVQVEISLHGDGSNVPTLKGVTAFNHQN